MPPVEKTGESNRMRRSSILILVFFWLALDAVLATSTSTSTEVGNAKPAGSSKVRKEIYVPYDYLSGGFFEPDPDMLPASEEYLRREVHRRRIFYDGVPMYFAEPQGYNLQRMQRGYADFGKIYVAGRSLTGNPPIMIARDPQGHPVTREASRDVFEYAHDVLAARVAFGDTATLAAYGYTLETAPPKKLFWFHVKPSPPKWVEVWNSIARGRDTGLTAARQLLNRQRFIKFTTSNGLSELGIRLLHDGRQHVKWQVGNSNPFFSHIH